MEASSQILKPVYHQSAYLKIALRRPTKPFPFFDGSSGFFLSEFQSVMWVPPPCREQVSMGCVPARNTSLRVFGQFAVASWPVSESMSAVTMPSGAENACTLWYSRWACALFINSVQIGRALRAPSNLESRLSSKPTPTHPMSLEVNPANQPSRDVPVFPAAGRLNPRLRTSAPVPELSTSSIIFSTRYATRGSSPGLRSGFSSQM